MQRLLFIALPTLALGACSDPIEARLSEAGFRGLTAQDLVELNRATYECEVYLSENLNEAFANLGIVILPKRSAGPLGSGDYVIGLWLSGGFKDLSWQRLVEQVPGQFSVSGVIASSDGSDTRGRYETAAAISISSANKALRFEMTIIDERRYYDCGAPKFTGLPNWL